MKASCIDDGRSMKHISGRFSTSRQWRRMYLTYFQSRSDRISGVRKQYLHFGRVIPSRSWFRGRGGRSTRISWVASLAARDVSEFDSATDNSTNELVTTLAARDVSESDSATDNRSTKSCVLALLLRVMRVLSGRINI